MKNLIANMTRQDKALWSKTAYTALVVVVATVLAHVPVYGIDSTYMSAMFGSASNLLAFTDILTGNSFSQLAMGGFAVTSFVFASIMMMLAGIIYPKFEKIHSDGESGRRLHDKITLVLAMLLTFVQGILVLSTAGTSTIYTGLEGPFIAIPMIQWLLGTFIIAYMAQKIHLYGIGNGLTVVLAGNIAARIPSDLISYTSSLTTEGIIAMAALIGVSILIAVIAQGSYLNVHLVQTNKAASVMNADGYLPMPVVIASVLPIIYASCFMMIPSLISMITNTTDGWIGTLLEFSPLANGYSISGWKSIVGILIYVLIIAIFALYASRLSFSSPDIANRMRERGDVIPGVRPGKDTEKYLEVRRVKLACISCVFLIILALVPDILCAQVGLNNMSFLGVSLIILMAAFWDMRLRWCGLTKHWNAKYSLFDEKKNSVDAAVINNTKEVA